MPGSWRELLSTSFYDALVSDLMSTMKKICPSHNDPDLRMVPVYNYFGEPGQAMRSDISYDAMER